jgi:predicted dienelactone hydrolase
MGKFWATQGYASLHLQHVGSDRQVWSGSVLGLPGRLKSAAQDSEAIHRVQDLSFGLTQVLASPQGRQINAQRIVAAGHSYGANTTLLAAGARVTRMVNGTNQALNYRDPRIKAAILISAPPFYGDFDITSILSPITIPTLHITATADEINVPGYHSLPKDRIDVFEATGSGDKTLAIFKDGSHSIFTDRLNTGGNELNPKVKIATRELGLAFLQRVFDKRDDTLRAWAQSHEALVARFEQRE